MINMCKNCKEEVYGSGEATDGLCLNCFVQLQQDIQDIFFDQEIDYIGGETCQN